MSRIGGIGIVTSRRLTSKWGRRVAGLAAAAALWVAAPPAGAAEGDAPVASAPTAQADDRRVFVFPLNRAGQGGDVRGGVVDELTAKGLKVTPVKQFNQEDLGNVSAMSGFARQGGARYAVFGDTQVVGGSARITGQVYDVKADRTLARVKSTGMTARFFDLQDDFVRQVAAALGASGSAPADAAAPSTTSAPAPAAAPVTDSYWAGYETFYDAGRAAPVSMYPPAPPQQPMGNFGGGNYGYGYGGYGYYGEYGISGPFPGGVVSTGVGYPYGNYNPSGRGLKFGQLGVSNAPPPPTVTGGVPTVAAGSFLPTIGPPTRIPAYNAPVQSYRSPYVPSPIGQPQRVGAPSLRPGTTPRPTG
ncbi:MAG: hypothetical protein JWO31_114 [Phycisphaerales bacterium]|nr:hypothetical protein [Phycisphaerales bacterium]